MSEERMDPFPTVCFIIFLRGISTAPAAKQRGQGRGVLQFSRRSSRRHHRKRSGGDRHRCQAQQHRQRQEDGQAPSGEGVFHVNSSLFIIRYISGRSYGHTYHSISIASPVLHCKDFGAFRHHFLQFMEIFRWLNYSLFLFTNLKN